MSDHYDAGRRALERAEADHLREPAWRTGEGCDDGCDLCGVALPDDLHLCDDCAALADADDLDALDGSEGE